jgi:hypothetical protein
MRQTICPSYLCHPRIALLRQWRRTRPSFQKAAFLASALLIFFLPNTARATNLKPETLKAWEEYVVTANAQMQERLRPAQAFLSSDEDPGRASKLRSGEILIHDWRGEAFVPNATVHDVLPVVRDYGCYKEVYRPVVVDSKAIVTGESEDQFSMLLMNKSLISKAALNSDFRSSYFRVDDRRWYSIFEAIRIQEIANYGTRDQHTLPVDDGAGLIWRIYTITRFEERDGGVYIEVEAIVLSRDIPISLRWIVDPIVRRVSRESLLTSLRQTQSAVCSAAKRVGGYAASGRCSKGITCITNGTGAGILGSFR